MATSEWLCISVVHIDVRDTVCSSKECVVVKMATSEWLCISVVHIDVRDTYGCTCRFRYGCRHADRYRYIDIDVDMHTEVGLDIDIHGIQIEI